MWPTRHIDDNAQLTGYIVLLQRYKSQPELGVWMAAVKSSLAVSFNSTLTFVLFLYASFSVAEIPERIFPFTFIENANIIEGVDFGQVRPSSFHQRFIVITNTSDRVVNNVSIRISGNYTVSNCMSVFQPDESCFVVLNYRAPAQASWDRKWLNIEFSMQHQSGSVQADSQRIPVIGSVPSLWDQPNESM